MWAVICKLLLAVIKFFHALLGNWGVAIILLTVVVKLAAAAAHPQVHGERGGDEEAPAAGWRRSARSTRRTRSGRTLEMMKLYQEAKVNPLGGCLPMLIQMPVWIALFTTLRNSYELYREPFIAPALDATSPTRTRPTCCRWRWASRWSSPSGCSRR